MIPMQCFLAAGFEQFVGILIVLGILVLKFVAQAQQASKQKGEDGSAPSRSSPPSRPQATSTDKVQSFLDQIAQQASGGRPATKQSPVVPPRPQPAPQARPVRKELGPVAAQRVRDRIKHENEPSARKRAELEQRHVKSKLDRREVVPRISTQLPRKPLPPTEKPEKPRVRMDDPAKRLDALLPADSLKRAIILRDILGPCRAVAPIESFRW